jgi:hypothetical protein
VGFLYLRYVCDPKELWSWVSDHINDEDEFQPACDKSLTMCVLQDVPRPEPHHSPANLSASPPCGF